MDDIERMITESQEGNVGTSEVRYLNEEIVRLESALELQSKNVAQLLDQFAACQAQGAKLAAAAQALADFPDYPDWADEHREEEIKLWNDLRTALTEWRGA